MRKAMAICAALLIFVCPLKVLAEEVPLVVQLLKDKLTIHVPANAKVEARGFSIMAAPWADDAETRVVFFLGKEKVVLMAQEMYALAGADFSKGVDEILRSWNKGKETFKRFPLKLSAGELKLVEVQKVAGPKQESSSDALLVDSVFVESGNGTVQRVSVYTSTSDETSWNEISTIARSALYSLGPGPNSSARPMARTVDIPNSNQLHFQVPEGHAVSYQHGPDFEVFHVYKLLPLGSDFSSLLIYAGYHPNFSEEGKTVLLKDRILGTDVTWYKRQETAEALIQVPKSSLVLHFIAGGYSDEAIRNMIQIAESISR